LIILIFVYLGTLSLACHAWSHCVAGIALPPVDANSFSFSVILLAAVRGDDGNLGFISSGAYCLLGGQTYIPFCGGCDLPIAVASDLPSVAQFACVSPLLGFLRSLGVHHKCSMYRIISSYTVFRQDRALLK